MKVYAGKIEYMTKFYWVTSVSDVKSKVMMSDTPTLDIFHSSPDNKTFIVTKILLEHARSGKTHLGKIPEFKINGKKISVSDLSNIKIVPVTIDL